MYYNYRKERLKSALIICFILAIAIFATHHIYYKFQNERNTDYSSESLDITFHEETGDKVMLTRVTPVTDAVGLASQSYTFTIKNNMTIPVDYTIKLVDDLEMVFEDNCGELEMPKDIIRVAIKSKEKTEIYTLSELQDGVLQEDKIKALGEEEYTIRIWNTQTTTLQAGSTMHYHGKIQIVEDENEIAILNRNYVIKWILT